jgi:hypothetical protein
MLADDAAVASAVLADHERAAQPLVDGLAPRAIHVSMNTTGAAMSKRLAHTLPHKHANGR